MIRSPSGVAPAIDEASERAAAKPAGAKARRGARGANVKSRAKTRARHRP